MFSSLNCQCTEWIPQLSELPMYWMNTSTLWTANVLNEYLNSLNYQCTEWIPQLILFSRISFCDKSWDIHLKNHCSLVLYSVYEMPYTIEPRISITNFACKKNKNKFIPLIFLIISMFPFFPPTILPGVSYVFIISPHVTVLRYKLVVGLKK